MKNKIILLVALLLLSLSGYSQIRVVNDKVTSGTSHTITPTWPKLDADGNRNPKQALIVIDYDGFPEKEISRTDIVTEINNPNGLENIVDNDGKPLSLIFISLDEHALLFKHPVFGTTRATLPQMKNKGIYSLTLQVDKRMDIDIEPLTDYESVMVYLDQNVGKESPAHFRNISLGTHTIIFEMPDGRREKRTIEVTPISEKFNEVTNPDFDMRKRIPLIIESTEKDASIFIDDNKVADQTPFKAELPLGNHTIKAVSKLSKRKLDIATINIKDGGEIMTIKLNPRQRCKFKVTGTFESSNDVPFALYVGKDEAYKHTISHAKGEQKIYEFDLPVGTKHKFKATYKGNEGKRTIKVSPEMQYNQVIKIKRRHKFIWPWEREYYAPTVGITAGYVQKKYEVKRKGGETVYKGTLTNWDENDGGNNQWLHGIRVGVQYQPTFKFGLGLYSGLFYEYYRSTTDKFDEGDGITSDFSKYEEHSLNIPVHLFYNMPLASKVAVALHGGVNFNLMVSQKLSGFVTEEYGMKFEDSYNILNNKDNLLPQYPGMFQMYWEVGIQVRLFPVMLGFQISRPITKHNYELDGEQFTTTAIKNSLSITYAF